jgi:hypothetical protein
VIDFYAIAPRERLTSCGECAAIVAVPDQSKHRMWHEYLAKKLIPRLGPPVPIALPNKGT